MGTTKLQEAIADLQEMLVDAQHVSHPYTDAHISEARRRAVRIGASLEGEAHNRYSSVLEVGIAALATIQKRNAEEILQPNGYVGVAGVESDSMRWEDRLESLEYSLEHYGLASIRNGDDSVIVIPKQRSVGIGAALSKLTNSNMINLGVVSMHQARKAVAGTYLEKRISGRDQLCLSKDDTVLLLDLLDEHGCDASSELKEDILLDLGLVV